MDLTLQFQTLLHSRSPNTVNEPTQQSLSSPFSDISTHLATQLQSLYDELILIRPLYLTPPPPKSTNSFQSQRSIPDLIHNPNTSSKDSTTIISTILNTSKQHTLTSLPIQWITLIDTFVKDSLSKISNSLVTMRTTIDTQHKTLDNIYSTKRTKNLPQMNITLNRAPIDEFINELKAHHKKKFPKPTQQQQIAFEQEYFELSILSYQSLEHKQAVLLSLEQLVTNVGNYVISLEKDRKVQIQQTSLQTIPLNSTDSNAINYSITGHQTKPIGHRRNLSRTRAIDDELDTQEINTMKKKSTNPFAINNTTDDDNFNTNFFDDEKDSHKRTITRRNNNTKNVIDLDNESQQSQQSSAELEQLQNQYGLTISQLEKEQKSIQTTIEQEEYQLASTVEKHLTEISSLISTFHAHILSQSSTVDNIYKDIIVVNTNIDYGNDQLDEALQRGGCGAKFYMYLFIICTLILLIFDFMLN